MILNKTKIMTSKKTVIYRMQRTWIRQEIHIPGQRHQFSDWENKTRKLKYPGLQDSAEQNFVGYILRHQSLINLKRKVYEACILPDITYELETITLSKRSAEQVRKPWNALCWNQSNGSHKIL